MNHRQLTMESITLPHLSKQPLQIGLFRDVKNAPFLRKQLLAGNSEFEYAFLDASAVISKNHVLAACFRAINDQLSNRLKSRNVHSEIVFSLSPNNNVSPVPCRLFAVRSCSVFRIIRYCFHVSSHHVRLRFFPSPNRKASRWRVTPGKPLYTIHNNHLLFFFSFTLYVFAFTC